MTSLRLRHGPEDRVATVILALGTAVRLVIAGWAAVIAGAIIAVGDFSVATTLFMVAGAVFAAWIVWDVLKAWGVVPAARIEVKDGSLTVSTPVWRNVARGTVLRASGAINIAVEEIPVIGAAVTLHRYELRQGGRHIRWWASSALRQSSAEALDLLVGENGGDLQFTAPSVGTRRSARRSRRNLDP